MKNKNLSTQHHTIRLFANDNLYLTKKVKELRFNDKRFENNAAAVRHYVQLGITYEKRTQSATTLDSQIIKNSQKEVIIETLQPLKNSIDKLINTMESFEKSQQEFFKDTNKDLAVLTRLLEAFNHSVSQQFEMTSAAQERLQQTSQEALRNAIVLRCILYVFLLGYKPGRIEPKATINWDELVYFAHETVNKYSIQELEHLAEGDLESVIVRRIAREMFFKIEEMQNRP